MVEKVLILGLSKSGNAAAKLAKNLGYDVYVTESKNDIDQYEIKDLENQGIHVEYGKHSEDFINNSTFVITSPGISPKSDIFKQIKAKNIPIISEIEFAYRNSDVPFIAITGTNGKTTTTSLVSHILSQAFDAPTCGNIGLPPSNLVSADNDFLVCEVSSFQAQMTERFKPFISCWTNFTPDHIDWHEGLENYFKAKAKIFLNKQAPEYVILNAKDEKLLKFSEKCRKSKIFFFDDENYPNASFLKENAIWYKEDGIVEKIIEIIECPLVGHHNYQNIMCGIICAKICGLENYIIKKAIKNFKAPEHRLEKIREFNGIIFYNDSKATNPEASIVAIDSFNNLDVSLILGGRDKNTDLTHMCQSINKHINTVFLIGEATERFEKELKKNGFNNIMKENTLEDAIDKAIDIKPQIVLLSPACASFDMFESYEHRGEVFKKYVLSK